MRSYDIKCNAFKDYSNRVREKNTESLIGLVKHYFDIHIRHLFL